MRKFTFSRDEIGDLLISAFILSFVVAYPFRGVSTLAGAGAEMGTLLLVLGTTFIFHELAHKFTAQSYGCWSEFRMWKEGLFFALLIKVLIPNTPFVFIAPGATYFSPFIGGIPFLSLTREQRAKISLAGPLTNVAMAFVFFALTPLLGGVSTLAVRVNLALAFFNLLPIGPLDGGTVASWNFWVWAATIGGIMVLQSVFAVI